MSETPTTTTMAVIAAVAGIIGAIGGPLVKGGFDLVNGTHSTTNAIMIAEQKLNTDLIFKALEARDQKEKMDLLILFSKAKLISNKEIRDAIIALEPEVIAKNISLPASPTARTEQPATAPRLYLLAGSPERAALLEQMSATLRDSGFNVIGAKRLIDVGRPDLPEIRYFNDNVQDRTQAGVFVSLLEAAFPGQKPAVVGFHDSSARPGYIEIWLGR